MEKENPIVLDTNVVIDGSARALLTRGTLSPSMIVIPRAVIAELEHQANNNEERGFTGLKELALLREYADTHHIVISYGGTRPSPGEITHAHFGSIDATIRDVAREVQGTLLTSDYVQYLVARAEGISVQYIPPSKDTTVLSFERFLTSDTLSLHLKEGVPPLAKRGTPGAVRLLAVGEKPLSRDDLLSLATEIVEAAQQKRIALDIDTEGATVVQLGSYRIVICRPPFSSGVEITVVRSVKSLSFEEYHPSVALRKRLDSRAEGILICGSPGAGKSTFAAALAEYYRAKGKIVKTMESPRDLHVSSSITQYGPLGGSFERTSDILLLVRPDYTIYDEMRRTIDFTVYADLRMAGIGMVGVVHAAHPIDAVQRFFGRVELGLIPQIVDTVIFIKDGTISKTYELSLVVRVPAGMTERDLARPLIEVRDFESGTLEYEIYKFGEETVVFRLSPQPSHRTHPRAYEFLTSFLSQRTSHFEIKKEDHGFLLIVPARDISKIQGKRKKHLKKLEARLGVPLRIISYEEMKQSEGESNDAPHHSRR